MATQTTTTRRSPKTVARENAEEAIDQVPTGCATWWDYLDNIEDVGSSYGWTAAQHAEAAAEYERIVEANTPGAMALE